MLWWRIGNVRLLRCCVCVLLVIVCGVLMCMIVLDWNDCWVLLLVLGLMLYSFVCGDSVCVVSVVFDSRLLLLSGVNIVLSGLILLNSFLVVVFWLVIMFG